jgi:septum formation protein
MTRELLKFNGKYVLASKSPRRKKLLEQIGLTFEVKPSSVKEKEVYFDGSPKEYAQALAEMKAQNIAAEYKHSDTIIIGADTIVVLDGKTLNKPIDNNNAIEMLKSLSGRTHTVLTGVALIDCVSGIMLSNIQTTQVTFRELDDDEIESYVAGGSPMDKAGAYGIQDDFGAVFVSEIAGCYYNIVGFPLEMFYTMLKNLLQLRK